MNIRTSIGKFKDAEAFVAVDVLRSSATICYGLKRGVKSFLVYNDLESVLNSKDKNRLKIGERYGMKVRGLDMANSPSEMLSSNVRGRGAVFYSNNLARIVGSCGKDKDIFIGTLCNANALARTLKGCKSVNFIACTYRSIGPLFFWEDLVGVGKIIYELNKLEEAKMDALSSFCFNLYRFTGKTALLLCPNTYYTALIAGPKEIYVSTREDNLSAVPVCKKEGKSATVRLLSDRRKFTSNRRRGRFI